MDPNLIFDVGMHQAEDTDFYLRKGFRVVAVEADPDLCAAASRRYPDEIRSGQLVIVNNAIADRSGQVTFYRNEYSPWSTLRPDWVERNRSLGADSVEVRVEAATLATLFERYGTPYYVKIDIEGMDLVALESIVDRADKPVYVSLESSKVSFADLKREFDILRRGGYGSFKLVPQHQVSHQVPPKPAREGQYVAHRFNGHASGLFGEEAPGRWLDADAAIEAYRSIFFRYFLTGDDPYVRSRLARALLNRVGFRAGWYDTHAKLAAPGASTGR